MTERILTLHPAGKNGVRIEQAKYDGMRKALLKVIPKAPRDVAFSDLKDLVEKHLPKKAFGPDVSRNWYVTTVKQDLEARGEIEIVPGKRPQHLRRLG